MAEAGKSLLVANVPTTLTAALTAGTTWQGKAQIVSLRATNKGSAEAWVSIACVRGGVTAYLLNQYSLDAKETYPETLHLILEIGDVVSTQASAANTIDVVLSGYEGVD